MKTNKPVKNELTILPEQKLSFIQKEFNELFPYLKLEFFRSRADSPFRNGKAVPLSPDLTLLRMSKTNEIKEITITGDLSVKELEKAFLDRFNIQIKVLRRSGRSWLETSLTNEWSLDLQNSQGKETSRYSE